MASKNDDKNTTAEAPKPTAELDGKPRSEQVALTFGAAVAAARQAIAAGGTLDLKLEGLEQFVPRGWVAPFAVLRAMLAEGVAPTERELQRRGLARSWPSIAEAIRDGAPLAGDAARLVAGLHELPPVGSAAGKIGGHRGGRRIKVTHSGHVGSGWKHRKPRPVTVDGITLAPGTSLEVLVNDANYLRWKAKRSVDVEVLEGEPSRVVTTV